MVYYYELLQRYSVKFFKTLNMSGVVGVVVCGSVQSLYSVQCVLHHVCSSMSFTLAPTTKDTNRDCQSNFESSNQVKLVENL